MLSGTRSTNDIPPEEHAMVQALIDEVYGKFKSVVEAGRASAHDANAKATDAKLQGKALSADWKDYADGRVLSGSEALRLGFVDQVGTFEDAVSATKAIAGISSANLVRYDEHHDLSDLLRFFGESRTGPVKVDLGLELPKLRAGQPYYLSPILLH
jgi:protease-4